MESVQGKQAIKTQIWAMENGKKLKKSLHKITLQKEGTESCHRSWAFAYAWPTRCMPRMFTTEVT